MIAANEVKVNLDGGKEGWHAIVSEKGFAICDAQRSFSNGALVNLEDAIAIAKAVLYLTDPDALTEAAIEQLEATKEQALLEEKQAYLDDLEYDARTEGYWYGWGAQDDGRDVDERIAIMEGLAHAAYQRQVSDDYARLCLAA